MARTVIEVNNVSKLYRLGEISHKTLSDDLRKWIAQVSGRQNPYEKLGVVNNRTQKSDSDYVWALKDISFEVKEGDVLGIVGRNGAGKSTLLKLLSRVTVPTKGTIKIKGRITSLLEVGTGFQAEMTGRENLFLNGAILGMRKHEIIKRFDEIVAFAGVESYIDTPVRRYSSGMYMRLAFAVAAHLESEILIVDEVLAVGDQEFQDKCIGKMNDVAHKEGKTVLFVSHNMAAVNRLCSTGILIKQGGVASRGEIGQVVNDYFNEKQNSSYTDLTDFKSRTGSRTLLFNWVSVADQSGDMRYVYSMGEDIVLKFSLSAHFIHKLIRITISMRASDGTKIVQIVDVDSGFQLSEFKDTASFSVLLKDIRLYPDMYFISLKIGSPDGNDIYDCCEDCINFKIIDGGKLTTRNLSRSEGLMLLTPDWKKLD